VLDRQERLIFVARQWSDTEVRSTDRAPSWPQPKGALGLIDRPGVRMLIIGWSRRIPALLQELESYVNQCFDVTIASRQPHEQRERQLRAYGARLERVKLAHHEMDCTVPEQLAALAPEDFDVVLCLASDLTETDEQSDARTLVAYAILRELIGVPGARAKAPRLVLELLDELNTALVDPVSCEYLLSPQVLSHMLAQVALRREMNAVYQELFNSGETEITVRNPSRYAVEAGRVLSFADLERLAREHDDIALGYLRPGGRTGELGGSVYLNPKRSETWRVEAGDQFIVLRK